MTTTLTIQNEQAEQFEHLLGQFDLLQNLRNIQEKSFHTHFIFNELNEEEETTLEALQNDLK